jgi:hypothetical protein
VISPISQLVEPGGIISDPSWKCKFWRISEAGSLTIYEDGGGDEGDINDFG